ncbi:hypothetical protein GCM10025881_09440 [Pseudolysinimonas kribbensis]|uniref:N-acylglucosamine-6-phosphate 2-epimerase n=1 Tax=Pseudolysinimonas kribbensis TaxID=433641 RepID=A0ABQ6K4W9_9MICO|nr:hypothetical protein [Pseudolysinimonas kribbensis]GMA94120.1 hypothetical protein GCM10025881_09440 [Pseudolysinimonas kribbensis]
MTTVLETIRGGLIASCQAASPDSPFRDPAAMRLMVEAVRVGGAVAARVESIAHVRAARDCGLPLVGLVKRASAGSDVYITPTVADVRALIAAGAAIVAADGTVRPREGARPSPNSWTPPTPRAPCSWPMWTASRPGSTRPAAAPTS